MTTRLSGIALAGLIAALGAMACGSSEATKKASPTKSEPKKVEGEVPCGPTICKPKPDFMGQLCCKSNFDGTCGQMVAGSCTDLPPDADKRCMSTTFMIQGSPQTVPSCCTANNECGLVFAIGGSMCTSITQLKQAGPRFMGMMGMGMGMGMGAMMLQLPDAVTCDGMPIAPPAAGASGGAAGGGM